MSCRRYDGPTGAAARYGTVTSPGPWGRPVVVPCRIEKEGTDRSGKPFLRCRFYDAGGFYMSTVDLWPEQVRETDGPPEPLPA